MRNLVTPILTLLILVVFTGNSFGQDNSAILPVIKVVTTPDGGQEYSATLQILILMTLLTFLPAIVIMMTSFIRISVVFAILRQALGLQSTPSNQILVGLTLFLSLFIMSPVISEVNDTALQPYLNEKLTSTEAFELAKQPFKRFMLAQVRANDLQMFSDMSGYVIDDKNLDDVSMVVLVPSFITSELKTAFQIGFLIFIPFLVIDLVIASILMAMGMMMLSPMIVSLPFKIMMFVLIDGWVLIVGTLTSSFG